MLIFTHFYYFYKNKKCDEQKVNAKKDIDKSLDSD